jgi:hypothetical protein
MENDNVYEIEEEKELLEEKKKQSFLSKFSPNTRSCFKEAFTTISLATIIILLSLVIFGFMFINTRSNKINNKITQTYFNEIKKERIKQRMSYISNDIHYSGTEANYNLSRKIYSDFAKAFNIENPNFIEDNDKKGIVNLKMESYQVLLSLPGFIIFYKNNR